MKSIDRLPSQFQENKNFYFLAQSGLTVNAYDEQWKLLPNLAKGHTIKLSWLFTQSLPEKDRAILLDAFVYYARTKKASTTAGVVVGVKPFVANGIPSLETLKAQWSGYKVNQKKSMNQLFSTLVKLGNRQFEKYHQFTNSNLPKSNKFSHLDPKTGALTDFELDSLCKAIDFKINKPSPLSLNELKLSFFQSPTEHGFSGKASAIGCKLVLSVLRRPIQICLLKWRDLIPTGCSFKDPNIHELDEVGSLGSNTLQLRVFNVKQSGQMESLIGTPEPYSIPICETLSNQLLEYKQLYAKGLALLFKQSEIEIEENDIFALMDNLPLLTNSSFFHQKFKSIEEFHELFNEKSTYGHSSENTSTNAFRHLKVSSDRSPKAAVTSNRVRHTALTRAAQDGMPTIHLAKMTGVTVPAVRHYVDMDYYSRQMIDSNFIANEFYKRAFNEPLVELPEGNEGIVDNFFNPIGIAVTKGSCLDCLSNMGKPISCYGCPNFRPLLEADHKAVLIYAENKLALNKEHLFSSRSRRSVERLQRQIENIKATIIVCDEIISRKASIGDK